MQFGLCFSRVITKNGIKVARSIKRDAQQFADFQTSMERKDLWALPTPMKAFFICV